MSARHPDEIFRNDYVSVRRCEDGKRVFWRVSQYNRGFHPYQTRHWTRRAALQLAHRVTIRREQPDLSDFQVQRLADERLGLREPPYRCPGCGTGDPFDHSMACNEPVPDPASFRR